MAEISAKDIAALRKQTGAGMLDCRTALQETGGDIEAAKDWLRTKGLAGAAKRAGREAQDGAVEVTVEGSVGAIVELNCETDFVAKNADFIALAQSLVEHADATRPANAEALLAAELTPGRTVAATVEELSAKIGEKLVVNRVAVLDGATPVAVYLHRKAPDLPPAVGVLVEYSGKADEAGEADARGVAMQIAAMRPKYLNRDEVPADVVATERRIAEETAREEGKPEAALAKIVEGRVNAFFKDFVLLEQASVQDQKKSVRQILGEAGITVSRFVRFEVGQA